MRSILEEDKITIDNKDFELKALTRACKLKNDEVIVRFPIYKDLLKSILSKLKTMFGGQPYLLTMYSALFSSAYYGLLRIGELTSGPHVITVQNVNVGVNKDKIMYVLPTSKTHNRGDKPQIIKIANTPVEPSEDSKLKTTSCPFRIIGDYKHIRPIA